MADRELALTISAKDEASAKMKAVGDSMQKMGSTGMNALKNMTIAAVALTGAVVGVTAVIAKWTMNLGAAAEKLQNLSAQTGISTDGLQALKTASDTTGVEFSVFEGAIRKVQDNLGTMGLKIRDVNTDLANHNIKAKDASAKIEEILAPLHRLGLGLDDLRKLEPEKQMFVIGEALAKVSDANERAALTTDLMGKSGTGLNAVFLEGGKTLEEWLEQAKRTGTYLSTDMIEKLAAFDDKMDVLKQQVEGVKNKLAIALLPHLEKLVDWIGDHMPDIQRFIDKGIQAIGEAFDWVGNTAIPRLIDAFNTYVAPILTSAYGWWVTHKEQILKAAHDVYDWITQTALPAINKAFHEHVEPILIAAATWWNEHKDEVWAAANAIYTAALNLGTFLYEVFTKTILKLLEDGKKWWAEHGESVKKTIGEITTKIQDIWTNVSDVFGKVDERIGGAGAAWEGFYQAIKPWIDLAVLGFQSLLDVINNIVGAVDVAIQAVTNLGNTKVDFSLTKGISVSVPTGGSTSSKPKPAAKPTGGVGSSTKSSGGITSTLNSIKKALGFDTGGIVPGPLGSPQLAVVHGGETILPTHKGSYGETIIVSGNMLLSERSAVQIVEMVMQRLRLQRRLPA